MELALLFAINTFVVSLVVMTHYEALSMLAKYIPGMKRKGRVRLLIGVFGALGAHIIEIYIFAIAYFMMSLLGVYGSLEGNYQGQFLDSVYFSFTTFSTLGYGDIEPLGGLRYLAGIESLTGLLLIAWSSSFLFVLMEKNWIRVGPTRDFASEQDAIGRD